MVNENIRIASEAEPGHLTEKDMETVEQVRQIIRERENSIREKLKEADRNLRPLPIKLESMRHEKL